LINIHEAPGRVIY